MLKRLLRNRKGTAEVIGTIMFIVILLFFFTNVYLWHDVATKDANELYLKKMNSSFGITSNAGNITVTADGGSDIVLSRLWIVDDAANKYFYADLGNVHVAAGGSFNITFPVSVTLPDGSIQVNYTPIYPDKCTVINTLGIAESTTFQP